MASLLPVSCFHPLLPGTLCVPLFWWYPLVGQNLRVQFWSWTFSQTLSTSSQIWFMSLIMTLTASILELSLPVRHLPYFILKLSQIFRQCVLKYNYVASLCGTRSHIDLNHRVLAHFHALILNPMSRFCFKADLFWKEEEDSCLELCVFIPLHVLILKSVSFKTFTLSMSIHFLSAGSPFLFVNTSGRYGGQRAQLLLPPLKENDTHCVSLLFYRQGATPTSLNIYVRGSIILA